MHIRKNKKSIIALLLIFETLSFAQVKAAENIYQIGNKFSANELSTTEKTYIIDYQSVDVTGDNIPDNILLIGDKINDKDDIYAENLRIVVQDSKSKIYSQATYEDLAGYESSLFIGDFDGDKIKDVMLSAATGGTGGTTLHLIACFKNNTPMIIFNEKDNNGVLINGKYINGFKSEIKIININRIIDLDLQAKKKAYIDNNIYDIKGKVLSKIEPYTIPFSKLDAVDYNGDGVYELKGYQTIRGFYNADIISNVESLWKYENRKWNISELQYSTFLIR